MDGQVDRVKRDVEFVREQRALNKVFGLKDPEPWSGAKQLVDFLDELFNYKKSIDAKIEKPVRSLSSLNRFVSADRFSTSTFGAMARRLA